MLRLIRSGLVLVVTIWEALLLVGAGSPVLAHPLLQMLGMVPKEISSTRGDPFLTFADLAAFFFVYGVQNRTDIQDLETLLSSVPISVMLGTCRACPEARYYFLPFSTRQNVGFEWLLDVDAIITFGQRPSSLVVKGRFEEKSIDSALRSRGFAVTTMSGAKVWYRFDDYEARLGMSDPCDPFWGYIGASARIALVEDCLLAARAWPSIEAMLLAYKGQQSSLLDDLALRTLAQTTVIRPGLLTQALFYRWEDLQPQDERAREFCKKMGITFEPALPPFQLAVLADIQLGRTEERRDQLLLIGLFYPDPLDASRAADVLASRVTRHASPLRTGGVYGSWVENYRGTVSSYVVNAFLGEGAVAIVEVRYPVPDHSEGGVATLGLLLYYFVLDIEIGDCWFFW